MIKAICICHGCKKEAEATVGEPTGYVSTPAGWYKASVKIGSSKRYDGNGYIDTFQHYHFCPECSKTLGFHKLPEGQKDESLGDRIIDAIYRIACEAIDQHGL